MHTLLNADAQCDAIELVDDQPRSAITNVTPYHTAAKEMNKSSQP